MKKNYSIIVTFVLTLAIAISSVMSTSTVALAAEDDTVIETASVQPRKSIVYPVSGSTSGYFKGSTSSNNAKYGHIPAGTYYFDYYYDSQNHAAAIVIESSSQRIEMPLTGDGNARSTGTFKLDGGTYTVSIVASLLGSEIEKYYSYTLILQ